MAERDPYLAARPRIGFRHPTASFLGTLVVALGGMAIAAALILWLNSEATAQFEFALPIMLVAAVIGLVASLAGLVPMFYRAGLTTSQRALGLPEGSVRALIALSFIIMFFITAVFLQSRVDVQQSTIAGVTSEEFVDLLDSQDLIVIGAELDPNGDTRTVIVGREASEGARQFADRMFTTVATIVVALSAFYFGNQSVNTARTALREDAELRIISPEGPNADLPGAGKSTEIRVAWLPGDAALAASASAGTLLRDESQPGLFRFDDPGLTDDVVLTFELPGHRTVQPVRLTLRAGETDDELADPESSLGPGEAPWTPASSDPEQDRVSTEGWSQALGETEQA